MPNNVINEIHLRGSASAILRLLNNCCEERGGDGIWRIDFCKIIPIPEGMEAVGDACYDWCIPNWGTKWNAYEHERPKFNPGHGYLRFQTVWYAPHRVVQEMSKRFRYVDIDHYWADEDIGRNCGHIGYLDGKVIEKWIADDGNEDSAKFAKLLWKGDKEMDLDPKSVIKKIAGCSCCGCGSSYSDYIAINKRTGIIRAYCDECIRQRDAGTDRLENIEIIFIGDREDE